MAPSDDARRQTVATYRYGNVVLTIRMEDGRLVSEWFRDG